jgi:hypothetical protein
MQRGRQDDSAGCQRSVRTPADAIACGESGNVLAAPLAPLLVDDPGRGRRSWRVGAALGLPAGAVTALVTCGLGGALGLGIALAAVVAAAISMVTTGPGALLGAAQCWACIDGFVVNRFGELRADRTDLVALAVVVTAAVTTTLLAAIWRRMRAPVLDPAHALLPIDVPHTHSLIADPRVRRYPTGS